MSILKRLNNKGRTLVDDAFLSDPGGIIRPSDDYLEHLSRSIDLTSFREVVVKTLDTYPPFATEMDGYMAPRIHQALPLTQREAGDIGVWHYLAAVATPELVRHRWQAKRSGMVSKERFLGDLVRNSFARLWWGAALTVRDRADYSLTETLFSKSQDMYEAIFGRTFSRYPAATSAFLDVVGSEPEDNVRLVAKNFTHVLTTVVLEDLNETEVKHLLKELLANVK